MEPEEVYLLETNLSLGERCHRRQIQKLTNIYYEGSFHAVNSITGQDLWFGYDANCFEGISFALISVFIHLDWIHFVYDQPYNTLLLHFFLRKIRNEIEQILLPITFASKKWYMYKCIPSKYLCWPNKLIVIISIMCWILMKSSECIQNEFSLFNMKNEIFHLIFFFKSPRCWVFKSTPLKMLVEDLDFSCSAVVWAAGQKHLWIRGSLNNKCLTIIYAQCLFMTHSNIHVDVHVHVCTVAIYICMYV